MDNTPTKIILHHSLTEDNKLLNNYNGIYNYHTITKGWSDIGYHWVLEYDKGILQWKKGRDEKTRGAHCSQDNQNYKSIGICVVGNYDVSYLNEEQIQMILNKKKEIELMHNRNMPIELHRNYATYKTCPGRNITLELFESDTIESILDEVTDNPIEWMEFIKAIKVVAEADTGALKFGKYIETLIEELYKA